MLIITHRVVEYLGDILLVGIFITVIGIVIKSIILLLLQYDGCIQSTVKCWEVGDHTL